MYKIAKTINWHKSIWIAACIGILYLFILFYFIPILENYRNKSLDLKKIQDLNENIDETIHILQQDIISTLEQNIKNYQNMQNKISIKELKEYTKKYINNVTIYNNGVQSTNNIKIQNLFIVGEVKQTKEILDFINNLKHLNHSIKIGFPINITKQKNNLRLELKISIYYSNYRF